MGRFWVLLLVVLLFVSVGVLAVKPTPQVSSGVGGITIVYTKAQAFTFGEDFDMYLHIFNSSNGLPYSNVSTSGISCFLHIYNDSDNEHILKGKFVYSSVDTFDWELEINHSIFSKTGFYPYIIFCNSSVAGGGFVSDELLISVDGEGELSSVSNMFLFAVILLPLLFGFLLIKWVSTLGDEHNVLKLFLSLLSVGTLFASIWLASLSVIKLFLWVALSDALSTLLLVYGIIYVVMIFYFLLFLLKSIFKGVMDNKDDKMEY